MVATSVSRSKGGAGQHLEQDAAERVDVGAGVDAVAAQLFGRDVVTVPMTVPVCVRPGSMPSASRARSRSGSSGRLARVGDEHVAGLDVTVHEPGAVGGVEGGADLGDDARRPRRLQPPLARSRAPRSGPST